MESYKFKISPLHSPDVWRVVELRADQKLRDLHSATQTEFGLEGKSPYYYFLSGKPWDKSSEYTHDGKAKQVNIKKLELQQGAKFLHCYDAVIEQWHRCEYLGQGTVEKNVTYPNIVESQGEPPDPFADVGSFFGDEGQDEDYSDEDEEQDNTDSDDERDDNDDADGSEGQEEEVALDPELAAMLPRLKLAVETYDKFFERDDSAEVDRPKNIVEADAKLARELTEKLKGRVEQLHALMEQSDSSMADWIDMLPFDLVDHKLFDDAIYLCKELLPLVDPAEAGASLATILSRSGKPDEAIEQAEYFLAQYPDSLELRVRAAEVLSECGKLQRAEELLRRVLEQELAGSDVLYYRDAIETLTEILRKTNRNEEAEELQYSDKLNEVAAFEDDEVDPLTGLIQNITGKKSEAPPEATQKEPATVLPFQPTQRMVSIQIDKVVRRTAPKVGRNDPCPCGSGKAFRHCHGMQS